MHPAIFRDRVQETRRQAIMVDGRPTISGGDMIDVIGLKKHFGPIEPVTEPESAPAEPTQLKD
jgi:hypothetical protein